MKGSKMTLHKKNIFEVLSNQWHADGGDDDDDEDDDDDVDSDDDI